jgi:hypothetical protein
MAFIKEARWMNDAAQKNIQFSYTENETTKTINVPIIVTARTLDSIEITSLAQKTEYIEGEYLDILGLQVIAHYLDSEDGVVTSWTHYKQNALTTNDTEVVISYEESGIPKTVSFAIVVKTLLVVDAEVGKVIAIINTLPEIVNITLTNQSAVEYAQSLYDALIT